MTIGEAGMNERREEDDEGNREEGCEEGWGEGEGVTREEGRR